MKTTRNRFSRILILAFLCAGCDGAIDSAYHEQIVVTGFIYAGSPIDSVILHKTTPFGEYLDDLSSAIDGATVKVIVDGSEHLLLPGSLKGRYYLPASDLIVQGGKTYELRVLYGQDSLDAFTTVPMPIGFTGLNDSLPLPRTLVLDTNNQISFIHGLTAGPIDEPNRKYVLKVTALDTSGGRINPSIEGPPVDTSAYTRYSFIVTAPRLFLYSRLFAFFGPNRVSFLALDTNWVDLIRQSPAGNRAVYQPSLNHVWGGLGVWASAAYDSVTVFIKSKD